MKYEHVVETNIPLPPRMAGSERFRSVDFTTVVHGSSVLAVDRMKAQSIRACLIHYKKKNPDKLVGIVCSIRKEEGSDKCRVFFVNPDLL